jgi:hypothetical protein
LEKSQNIKETKAPHELKFNTIHSDSDIRFKSGIVAKEMNDADRAYFEAEGHLFYDILPTGNIVYVATSGSAYKNHRIITKKLLLINLLVFYDIHINTCMYLRGG